MLVDSHCHLDRLSLKHYENGLPDAIAAATEAGVSHMLCVCISEENRQAVLDIAHKYHHIFASVGIHPSDVKERVVSSDELKQWAQAEKVVAIGETGLDYYYTKEHMDAQAVSFANHLNAAGDLGLPVIVHTRDAREDTIALIKEHGNIDSAGVLHCFTENWEMAKQALDLNYYISISGIVTFKNAEELREVVRKVPIEKLLIETDSPYLAPVPMRGKSNEPAFVKHVAQCVADLKQVSYQELCDITAENFFRLFSKAAK
ncbi:putative metal-dependent hydrolase YcfH [Thalassocella blandensis]|nr:putative metal-dependent hydrolase YcfH [Thalassocella blandensis]